MLVGEYMKLKLLGLQVWLKVMLPTVSEHILHEGGGGGTHELVFTSLVYY